MRETVIILYAVILQLDVIAVAIGILTYVRYRKKSLQYFLLIIGSFQPIEMGLLLGACAAYAGKESLLLRELIKLFDLSGTAVLLFGLAIFPFFLAGRKPGKLLKTTAVLLSFAFTVNNFVAYERGAIAFPVVNKAIIAIIMLTSAVITLSSLPGIGKHFGQKIRAVGFLAGICRICLPPILTAPALGDFSLFPRVWFEKPLSLPFFLFLVSGAGLLLIKTYFSIPFYVNPEDGALSEFFVKKFGITEREGEIIMLLRKGKAYKEIAEELDIAYKTVDAHIQNIYSKAGVNNKRQLVNLIETPSL